MDSKDELLAKLKAIDATPPSNGQEPELKAVSPPAPNPTPEKIGPQISTDDFLAKLEALDQATRPEPPPIPSVASTSAPPPQRHSRSANSAASRSATPHPTHRPPTSEPFERGESIRDFPTASSTASSQPFPARVSAQPYVGLPNVIERLKQFTQAQLAAHAAQNQAKAKRAQEIARAQAWLDELDPLSDDGFWFEQFSESYESRIEAALDFLNPGRA